MRSGFCRFAPVHMKYHIDAIPHIEIRFFLRAISEDLQMVRVFEQLFVKIEHVPVCVSLAKNGDEPKNVTLKTIPLAISINQSLARQFGSGIKRGLDGEGSLFGS